MAAGMVREQRAGVLGAVLMEKGRAADKKLGPLGLLVVSVIHGTRITQPFARGSETHN